MNKKTTDIFVVGFALFSIFFGAGNLLFPPYLGLVSGQDWFISFLGFIIGDAGLALLVIVVAAKNKGILDEILVRGGKKLARFIGCAAILCIGPFLAIPRTAATTFEMSILPFMPNLGTAGSVIFSIIFFVATYFLTIKSTKVLDIIGKFLTPVLLLSLLALIIKGVITPIGPMSPDHMIDRSLFSEGLSQGYLTMDALGASAMAGIMINTLVSKGYKDTKDQISMTIKSGFVAGIALSIVYGGLCYLGATVSTFNDVNAVQTQVIVNITQGLLGNVGKTVLAVAVALACLTTSIGLTSATGQYFTNLTKGKISYGKIVLAVCVFSACMASIGVGAIIKFASPILSIVYPPTIVLIVLAFFNEKIENDNVYKFATYMSLIISTLTVLQSYGVNVPFINSLPFAPLGFNWVVPVIVAGLIGNFVKSNKGSNKKTC